MNRLTEALADICRTTLLREKWLIAPSRRVGHQWQEAVARSGQPVVQLRIKTIKSVAMDLAAPDMARRGVHLAPSRARTLLLEQTLHEAARGPLRYLHGVEMRASFVEAVAATLQGLRLAGIEPGDLRGAFLEAVGKNEDLSLLLERFLGRLHDAGLVDDAEVVQIARRRVHREPQCLRDVLLIIPKELLELAALQQDLLDQVPDVNKIELPVDPPRAEQLPCDGHVQIGCCVGEVNEVRAVLSRCLADGVAWDRVELLHTDAETYVPLIHETLQALEGVERNTRDPSSAIPATFAEGIPCRYARPGRALAEWVKWIREDFPQSRLVAMVRDGLVQIPGAAKRNRGKPREPGQAGAARQARLLRGVAIGFGRDRYLPQIDRRIEWMTERLKPRTVNNSEDEPAAGSLRLLGGDLETLKGLRRLVEELVGLAPVPNAPARTIVRSAQKFLNEIARKTDRTDSFAHERLCDELVEMERWLPGDARDDPSRPLALRHSTGQPSVDEMFTWLESLPSHARILGSGPRPGHLHVDSVHRGGHTGRSHTFIVGLDDSRFPMAGLQDPLLLDAERRELSPRLRTAVAARTQSTLAFGRLLSRLHGELRLSYSCRSVTEDREMFPSGVLLDVYRQLTSRPSADQQGFLKWLDRVESFAPYAENECLSPSQWWLWRLTQTDRPEVPAALFAARYRHLARGRRALARRHDGTLNPHSGLVAAAGARLDPTVTHGTVMSAHGLELAGRCPRAFFFRYGLEISAPEELVFDPLTWLDPLTRGVLLHELFERFMRHINGLGHPPLFARDAPLLKRLLEQKLSEYRELYPVPSESVYQREARRMERTARTFLREEERFCRQNQAMPVYLEASLGMPPAASATALDALEPVPVPLSGGRALRVRGRIDRIDRLNNGLATFAVWDYKTGSAHRFEAPRAIDEGRVVQPVLYVSIVGHRLREIHGDAAEVSYFGFFFPDVRSAGQRIQYSREQLDEGVEVLEQLCRLIAGGAFVATHETDDCRWCDYRSICGDVEAACRTTAEMLERSADQRLEPMRRLRGFAGET
jgi:ATP-dependent helicase/nuclease subunit B